MIPTDALCLVTRHILPVIVSVPQMQHPDGVAAHRRLVVSHKAILQLLCVQQRVHRRRVGLALEVQPKQGVLRLTHRVKSAHYIGSHIVLRPLIPADGLRVVALCTAAVLTAPSGGELRLGKVVGS